MPTPQETLRRAIALVALAAAPIVLHAQPSDPPDRYEPNDDVAEARTIFHVSAKNDIRKQTYFDLTLHDVDDVDYYQFWLPTGAHYDVTVSVRDAGSMPATGYTADVGISAFLSAEGTWTPVYDNSHTIEDDPGNTTVVVKVRPIFAGSIGTYALHIEVVSRMPPSGIAPAGSPAISIAPIPASGSLTVATSDDASIRRCELVDIRGDVVAMVVPEGSQRSVRIDLDGVGAGTFLLRMHTSSGIEVRRVVVAR